MLHRRDLTLIELLLVLTILAAVAASAASFVEEADEQLRYRDTQNRLEAIRRGVLGRSAGEGAGPDGFVADLGALPGSLRELFSREDETGAELLPAWALDDASGAWLALRQGPSDTSSPTGLGFGWRGPYVHSLPRAGGGVSYPDGWGNVDDPSATPADRNFGWKLEVSGADWRVFSLGRDGRLDGTPAPSDPYARDYPSAPLVRGDDYRVDLRGAQLQVSLLEPSSGWPAELRLRLRYLRQGASGPEQVSILADPVTTLPSGSSPGVVTFEFQIGSALPSLVPWGPKALDLVAEPTSGDEVRVGPGNFGWQPLAFPVRRVSVQPRAGLPETLLGTWSES